MNVESGGRPARPEEQGPGDGSRATVRGPSSVRPLKPPSRPLLLAFEEPVMTVPLAELAVGVLLVAALLFFRASVVSLNRDMRAILVGQSEIRARLDALEKRPPPSC